MWGKRFKLFDMFGFAVYIDLSWFFIFALLSWSLASGLLPERYPGLSGGTYWTMGVIGALGLFASVLLHEFSHSLVARRNGLPMRGITLFIFGGVAEMSEEPPSPRVEFLVAIAGLIASVVIGTVMLALHMASEALAWPVPVQGVLAYLWTINFLLAAFNSIPAFPLDGGRVLRSIVWRAQGSLRKATRITAAIGSGFGAVLIGLGLLAFIMGNPISGAWSALIGLFLRGAAAASYQQVLVREMLGGEPVRRFMTPNPVTVSPELSVEQLVNDYVYQHHHKLYPVTEGQRLAGYITTRAIKEIPRSDWPARRVRDIMLEAGADNVVSSSTDAVEALARMRRSGLTRLAVVDGDRLVGILSLKDLLSFFALKTELEEGG